MADVIVRARRAVIQIRMGRIPVAAGDPGAANPWPSGSETPQIGFCAPFPAQWPNMPTATTRLFGFTGSARYRLDLTGRDRVRLLLVMGSTLAFAGARAGVRFSVDDGATFVWADGTSASDLGSKAPYLPMDASASTLQESAWTTLDASLRAPVLVELVGDGGNDTTDPTLMRFQVQGGTA